MPLALELAAAWADMLPLEAIAADLQGNLDLLETELLGVPERHRSMRAAIDYSWERLDPAERELFSQLCIFRGGFTWEAAQQVTGGNLRRLARLANKSLLLFDKMQQRYQVHELLRQFGYEKLGTLDRLDDMLRRHFTYYLGLAEDATNALRGPQQGTWLDRLESEEENFRAALAYGLDGPGQADELGRLALGLAWYWRIHSRIREGHSWLVRALESQPIAAALRASLNFHAGHMSWMKGDFVAARQYQEDSLALWRTQGQDGLNGEAYTRHSLGMIALEENEPLAAREHFTASLDLFSATDDNWGLAFANGWLGHCFRDLDDPAMARRHIQKSLEGFQKLGDSWAQGLFLVGLAYISWETNDLAGAGKWGQEAVEKLQAVQHGHSLVSIFWLLAQIAHKLGNFEEARSLYEECLERCLELGLDSQIAEIDLALASLGHH
jgi:tetratricopeptide (TPR) repeat protein